MSSAKEKQRKERMWIKIFFKKKKVRGDQHIKGYGSQIFKSRSKSTMKNLGVKLGEIIEKYKMLLFSKF